MVCMFPVLVNSVKLHVSGLGMHSWERSGLECINFVDNIWNVVLGSKLGGFSLPRKLCKRCRSVNKNVPNLWVYYCSRFASQGIYLSIILLMSHESWLLHISTFSTLILLWWNDKLLTGFAKLSDISLGPYHFCNPFVVFTFRSGNLSLWVWRAVVCWQQWKYTKFQVGIMGHSQAHTHGRLWDDLFDVQL